MNENVKFNRVTFCPKLYLNCWIYWKNKLMLKFTCPSPLVSILSPDRESLLLESFLWIEPPPLFLSSFLEPPACTPWSTPDDLWECKLTGVVLLDAPIMLSKNASITLRPIEERQWRNVMKVFGWKGILTNYQVEFKSLAKKKFTIYWLQLGESE